jgi:hypothetical protein
MNGESLYKYVSIKGLKKILKGSIRFTQPGAFNDPFDLLPELVIHKDDHGKNLPISFDISAERRNPSVGEVDNVEENFVSSDLTSRNIVKDLNKLIGIFCLSKTSNSLLMWSHYADKYTGDIVEFDAGNAIFSGQIDVEYRKKRQRKDLNSYLATPIPISEICVKSVDWEYEEEVRIIRKLFDCINIEKEDPRGFPIYVQKIPQECIKSIILGERTAIIDQKKIYHLVKNTEIGLSLSAIDNNGYQFRRELIKLPGPQSKLLGPVVSPRTAHIFSDLKTPLGDFARSMINRHPLSYIVNNTL